MAEAVLEAIRGDSVNGSGTMLAAAKPMGTAAVIDLTDRKRDFDTLVPYGNMWIPISEAIEMGLLRRNASNTLEELNRAAAGSRTDA